MKMIKNLVLLSAVAASTVALAAQPGFYAGVTAGYSMSKYTTDYVEQSGATVKKNGFAYGAQGGYNFDQYFGVEAAYNKLASTKFEATGMTTAKINLYDIDLLAVGYLPVAGNVDLVGKLGLAYLKQTQKNFAENYSTNSYRPKIALGASYAIQPNMDLQATYSRIFKKGNVSDDKYNPNIDMFAISFNYSFGGGNSNSDMM